MNTTLRDTVKDIDSRFFAGTLRKLNQRRWEYKIYKQQKTYTKKIATKFTSKINIKFNPEKQSLLGELLDKYGSAKCHGPSDKAHCIRVGCYHHIYNLLFCLSKNKVKILLECGIGSKNTSIPYNMAGCKSIIGGSLRAYSDYFPNAQIIGLDIDPDVMFTENRISTFECDQTSKTSIDKFITQANMQPNTIDIIIDDGLHEFNANITLFENTKHLLKDNGIYIIEDLLFVNREHQKFTNYFNNLTNYDSYFITFIDRYLLIIVKN